MEPAIFKERQDANPRARGKPPLTWSATKPVPGRRGEPTGLRLLRLPGGALSHRRRPAPGAWPHRLRRLYLGHQGRLVLGPGVASPELLHRSAGEGRHLRRPKASSTSALVELIDRYQPKAAFVYSTCIVGIIGDDLEAVCQPSQRGEGHSGAAGPLRGLQRHQEGRLSRRLRGYVQADGHRRRLRHQPQEHQYPRRFQPGRRDLGDPRLSTSGWASRWWPLSPATAAWTTFAGPTAPL